MAHQSLYRRYRPQRFSEVRGQPIRPSTIRRAVREKLARVPGKVATR